MKKSIAKLICLCLAFFVLCFCGDDGDTFSASDASANINITQSDEGNNITDTLADPEAFTALTVT